MTVLGKEIDSLNRIMDDMNMYILKMELFRKAEMRKMVPALGEQRHQQLISREIMRRMNLKTMQIKMSK